MPDYHTLKILEFEDIKTLIAQDAYSELGVRELESLYPMENVGKIIKFQERIRQVRLVLEEGGALPLAGLSDLSGIIFSASKGAMLSNLDLLEILKCLQLTAHLRKFLGSWKESPYVAEIIHDLTILPHLQGALSQTFDKKGVILDSASPRLAEIRMNLRGVEEKIQSRLRSLFKDSTHQKMLQEQIITTREGRFVIPVKQEYRGVFDGLVQDTSSSGATVFMEPISIVDENNELRGARLDEKKEIEQILRNLSQLAGKNSRELTRNLQIMGYLDMIGALARFALKRHAILPAIGESGPLRLSKARHPLLGEKAIPIDMEIGHEFNILVITGPNTGGKTVSLKTLGLFALMGLSGMPILADEGSHIPLLSHVFADIGDEQSITQNLSTFSSHMSQIIRILQSVDGTSLVLLDELGAGTDPKEGTALGIALLEHLSDIGAKTAITTHYGELKYFASQHPDARNAAMEFDSETLQPSYRIVVGLPGRSCALSIAGRLGLPPALLERAESVLTDDYMALDRLLQELKDKEGKMQREMEELEKSLEESTRLKESYRSALHFIETEKTEVLTQAFSEAEDLFYSARQEIKKILKDFKKKIIGLSKSPQFSKNEAEEVAEESFSKLDEILKRLEDFRKKKDLPAAFKRQHKVKPGDRVYIPSLGKEGEVLEIDGDEFHLQVEKMKMILPFWKAEPIAAPQKKPVERAGGGERNIRTVASNLDLRGHHVDEALYELEKFIDDALLAEARSFSIIHGKGTGALRKAIHLFLKKHPQVTEFRLGESHEGSWGVTVVTLR